MIENFVNAVAGKEPLKSDGTSSYWTDWVIEEVRRNNGSAPLT